MNDWDSIVRGEAVVGMLWCACLVRWHWVLVSIDWNYFGRHFV